MGRKIKFNLMGVSLQSEIVKVDRSKIYGSVKKVVEIIIMKIVFSQIYIKVL